MSNSVTLVNYLGNKSITIVLLIVLIFKDKAKVPIIRQIFGIVIVIEIISKRIEFNKRK